MIFDDNTANTDLYLESYIEPEVPELVEKIRKLCNAQLNDLMFSPIAVIDIGRIQGSITESEQEYEHKI